MNPFPGDNSVLILDNASIHMKAELSLIIERGLGGIVEFLPPYSPDFNPIEKMFGAYKTFIRNNPTVTANLDPFACISHALASITPTACHNWFAGVPFYKA
jgi:transposase